MTTERKVTKSYMNWRAY